MVWRCAGHVGIDPGPFTLRQLLWMAESSWDKTADLLKMIYDVNRDPSSAQNFSHRWFNRYTRRERSKNKSSIKVITSFGEAFARDFKR